MFSEKIEQLEKLVSDLVGELRDLKAENKRLTERINKFEREEVAASDQEKKFKAEMQRRVSLEHKTRKMENEKIQVRSRVKTILRDLEKMDFG